MYLFVFICICMYLYVFVCICMYLYVFVCICMYLYVFVCICMYLYVFVFGESAHPGGPGWPILADFGPVASQGPGPALEGFTRVDGLPVYRSTTRKTKSRLSLCARVPE